MRERLPRLVDPYNPQSVKNSAYELSMGDEAYITDSRRSNTRIRLKIRRGQHVIIPAGQLALLLVHESIEIPQDALGFISMKSRFKMRGLVNVSGFHVDPGYQGKLVFSVFNAGSNEIMIRRREPTFLLWFTSLDRYSTDPYAGARQGQSEITSDQYMNLSGPTYNPTALAQRVAELERTAKTWRNILIGVLVIAVASLYPDLIEGLQDLLSAVREWADREPSPVSTP